MGREVTVEVESDNSTLIQSITPPTISSSPSTTRPRERIDVDGDGDCDGFLRRGNQGVFCSEKERSVYDYEKQRSGCLLR
ncbi:hypothetical protein NL676_002489 [Syzygium grande]|nr:hypothetical protein NL676_002489 [Syzygium grande]